MSALHNRPPVDPTRESEPEPSASNPFVRKLQGLVNLTAADIRVLEKLSARPSLYGPNIDLILEGATPKNALRVLEGFACRYKQRQSGQRQITAYLLPGDLCSADVPDCGPMDHAVGTLSPCLVARISHQALAEVIADHPNIAQALRSARRAEVETVRAWIVSLGCRSALERMAHLFCELMTRFEAVGLVQDSSCPVPLTQIDLGCEPNQDVARVLVL